MDPAKAAFFFYSLLYGFVAVHKGAFLCSVLFNALLLSFCFVVFFFFLFFFWGGGLFVFLFFCFFRFFFFCLFLFAFSYLFIFICPVQSCDHLIGGQTWVVCFLFFN